MKLKSDVFDMLKWLVNAALKFMGEKYPLTLLGSTLIITALKTTYINGVNIYTLTLCPLVFACGVFLIYVEAIKSARHTARVLITGLPGTTNTFPSDLLGISEQRLAREPIELSLCDPSENEYKSQVEKYNAELCVDLFKRFILHDKCKKLYIGGLARIPFLVAYGAFLRNITAQIIYFDRFHNGNKWKLLDDEDKNILFADYELISTPNDNGDLGIAIGFSTCINIQCLPSELKGHTTMLTPNVKQDRNLIKNQENLERISEKVRVLIEKLSHSTSCKRIHLFLSVQPTLAIEIGRRFQDGTQRNWIIHNFNASKGEYEWAVELSKDGIKKFNF